MPYNAEVTFHQGSEREFTWEGIFKTLQDTVEHIEAWSAGNTCRAWINNKEVTVRYGKVLGNDGEPLCTNEKWHEIFAPVSMRIPQQGGSHA